MTWYEISHGAEITCFSFRYNCSVMIVFTLQGTNMSHLGKRKIIDSKVMDLMGYVNSQEGN